MQYLCPALLENLFFIFFLSGLFRGLTVFKQFILQAVLATLYQLSAVEQADLCLIGPEIPKPFLSQDNAGLSTNIH